MLKVWLIVKREYASRVRTKAFVWGTIALPLLSIGIIAFQIILSLRQPARTMKLALLDLDDESGLATSITQHLTEKLSSGLLAFRVVKTVEHPASEGESRAEPPPAVRRATPPPTPDARAVGGAARWPSGSHKRSIVRRRVRRRAPH